MCVCIMSPTDYLCVESLNKGHFCTNINYVVLSFVVRLSYIIYIQTIRKQLRCTFVTLRVSFVERFIIVYVHVSQSVITLKH